MRPPPVILVVDSVPDLKAMITFIHACHKTDPQALDLYMDTEGDQLNGGLSLFQVFLNSRNTVYIIDVLTLKDSTFDTTNSNGMTFQNLLEDSAIRKAFYDIIDDSHKLFKSYGIRVAGIEDISLYAIAAYGGNSKQMGRGLARSVKENTKCDLSESERKAWAEIKEWGGSTFTETESMVNKIKDDEQRDKKWVPTFNQRPIRPDVLRYAVQDVTVLPIVHRHAWAALKEMKHGRGDEWKGRISEVTLSRVSATQSHDFQDKREETGDYGVADWKGIK